MGRLISMALQATCKEGYGAFTAAGCQAGRSDAEVPNMLPSSQASLRPAAAQAASEHLSHSSQGVHAGVPVLESLQQEIERLQHLEQRSALLQAQEVR